MLHFIFSFFQITFSVTKERLLLFKSIPHLFHFSVEFSDDVFFLSILQFTKFWYDLINHSLYLAIIVINLILFDVPILSRYFIFVVINFICNTYDIFPDHSDFEIFLKFINFLSIILFSLDKSTLSSSEIVLNFLIFIIYFLLFLNDVSEALIPITRLRVFITQFFHYKSKIKVIEFQFDITYIHEGIFPLIYLFNLFFLLMIYVLQPLMM